MKILSIILLMMTSYNSCFQTKNVIPLPIAVDTAAFAREWNDALWVLINEAGQKRTQLLRGNDDQEIEIMGTLPVISSSLVSCKEELLIMGADSQGTPVLHGLNTEGQPQWSHKLEGAKPIIWPVVVCGENITIAWQESLGVVKRVRIDKKTKQATTVEDISVTKASVQLTASEDNLWASWQYGNGSGIEFLNLAKGGDVQLLPEKGQNEFRLSMSNSGMYFAWIDGSKAFWVLPNVDTSLITPLEKMGKGNLRLVSGGAPLVWSQETSTSIDGDTERKTILKTPDADFYSVDGLVFDVVWWKNKIAVIKASSIALIELGVN